MSTVADFEHFVIAPGFDLYVHSTPRFKNVLMKVNIHQSLGEDATGISLLPQVLRRGCRGATSMQKIVVLLEELYGASLGCDVFKLGERHVMTFRMEVINDRFAPKKVHCVERGIRFLSDILLHPVKKEGGFRADHVEQEKENLRRLIEGRINDRGSYAFDRCVEEMCAEEPYGIYEYGVLDRIPGIHARGLMELKDRVLATAPIHLFVVGDVKPETIAEQVAEAFRIPKRDFQPLPAAVQRPAPVPSRECVEQQEVEQGNLVIGYRTGMTWNDPDIFPLIFANAVLGGFPHSKLFVNVRERDGLAYSASSSLERTKGLMFLTAGIDCSKYSEALRTIREQVEALQQGEISDEEDQKTRMSLVDAWRSRNDSPSARVGALEEYLVNDRPMTPEDLIAGIENITREDIARAAGRIKEDTVYFLTNANENV